MVSGLLSRRCETWYKSEGYAAAMRLRIPKK
jgi:hypothetical protein